MAAKGGGVPIWPTTDGQGAVFRCCWGGGGRSVLLSVPCEGRKMCLAHAFSLWQRGGSAALQMARVPCTLVGRLIDTHRLSVLRGFVWSVVVGRVVFWVFLSSALRASVGLCMPLALSNFVDLPTKN